MSIESDIFKQCRLDKNKLIPYGFIKQKDCHIFSKNILDNSFKINIKIDSKGVIEGKIIELETKEEYTNYRVKTELGSFSSSIKQEFINVLEDIKKHCYLNKFFTSEQANRICDWIIEKYANMPEFLWEKSPQCGVFRDQNNNKWYGIIMNVKRSKLDTGNDDIDVLNIKLDKTEILELLSQKGFYKAYHMNKQHWISIILDDTINDEHIQKLIDKSHSLIL